MTIKSKQTTYRLGDFYKIYNKSSLTRKRNLNEKDFKKVIKSFLGNMLDAIIDGQRINMGYHLGSIGIGRFERNFSKPQVNWNESLKYKAQLLAEGKQLYDKETGQGHEYIIYFTDPHYYGFLWKKEKIRDIWFKCGLHNVEFYKLKIYARTQRTLSANIDELSPIKYPLHEGGRR